MAPSQTLNNTEYHELRDAARRVASSLGIVGECNDNAINPANRGALWFQLTTTGISTHMGEINNGISPIESSARGRPDLSWNWPPP